MIRTLLNSLREHKKGSWTTIFLSVMEVVMEIIIPLCMADLIDFGIEAGNMDVVWKYAIALLIFALLELGVGMLSAHIGAKAAAGFAANLRQDMYDNVQTFAFSNIDKFSTASIVTRLTTDVTNVQNAYQMLIRMAIRGPIMIVFSMIVSFGINRSISLVFLAVIPVLAILLSLIILKVHPVFERVFHTYDGLNNVVQENLRGIRVVKSFNQEEHETGKFKKISQSIYEDFGKGERLIALNSPLMQACMYACMILISWIGAKAILASGNNPALGLTTGDLTALITYAIQILTSLMMLSMVFAMITIASSSAKRIGELLQEKTDIANPEQPVYEVSSGEICFENVSFSYASKADKKVLDRISLHIPSGQTVGILGGTGSSKTSLVQLIPRLYDITDGSLTVGGVDVRRYDLDTLRSAVAMVWRYHEPLHQRYGHPAADDRPVHGAACFLRLHPCGGVLLYAVPQRLADPCGMCGHGCDPVYGEAGNRAQRRLLCGAADIPCGSGRLY